MTRIPLALILCAGTALADGPAPAPVDPVVKPPRALVLDPHRTNDPANERPSAAPAESKRPQARPDDPDPSPLPS